MRQRQLDAMLTHANQQALAALRANLIPPAEFGRRFEKLHHRLDKTLLPSLGEMCRGLKIKAWRLQRLIRGIATRIKRLELHSRRRRSRERDS